jgi:hypothetical protein
MRGIYDIRMIKTTSMNFNYIHILLLLPQQQKSITDSNNLTRTSDANILT